MSEIEAAREILILRIIDREWVMFHGVKASEPASCQEAEGTFRLMRWMSHSVLPEAVLLAIEAQLEAAATLGRNLMTEKYARMAGQIPPLKQAPQSDVIRAIVAAETEWLRALGRRYPLTFPGSGERFGAYLAGELETYADDTLALYGTWIAQALEQGRNPVQERYQNLFRRMGYASIEEREQRSRMEQFKCCR
jgi:hypothetical protein